MQAFIIYFVSFVLRCVRSVGLLTQMKKAFSSDDRRMRYAESEKTAKNKHKEFMINA